MPNGGITAVPSYWGWLDAFTVTDSHRLPSAGLPAHPSTASIAAECDLRQSVTLGATQQVGRQVEIIPDGFGAYAQFPDFNPSYPSEPDFGAPRAKTEVRSDVRP